VILHRDGGPRREDGGSIPASVPDIGRSLRRERTRQGLSIEEVSSRTGLAAQQLQGLESGTVDRLPDRVHTLKVLRHYADFLGLPGDRYLLVLVEHWPTGSLNAPVVTVHTAPPVLHDDTGLVPPVQQIQQIQPRVDQASVRAASHLVDIRGLPLASSVGLNASTASTVSSASIASSASSDDTHTTAQVPRIDRTGPLPVVDRWSDFDEPRTPVLLRGLIWILSLALLVGVAGIVINWTRPQWLRDIGITRAPTTAATTTTSRPGTTTTAAPTFTQVSSTPTAATFDVRSSPFVVAVVPDGSPSWVQANADGAPDPAYSGIVQAGEKQSWTVNSSLVVVVGASSARLYVSVGNHLVGSYAPPGAPFTITFQKG
jgi:transcriptional regulator with XRE-family HTH domain